MMYYRRTDTHMPEDLIILRVKNLSMLNDVKHGPWLEEMTIITIIL